MPYGNCNDIERILNGVPRMNAAESNVRGGEVDRDVRA
jgi:hypothetical protein